MISEDEIKILIETSYNTEINNYNEDLMDLGVIDSLAAMQLVTILESKFGVKFSFIEYTGKEFFTVKSLTNSINDKI